VNKLQIEGEILFEDKIRYTPSGLVVQSFKIGHKSFQQEANLKKDVSIELEAIFIDKHMRKRNSDWETIFIYRVSGQEII